MPEDVQELPQEMDEFDAGQHLDSLFTQGDKPQEESGGEVALNAAGKPYDPKTGRLISTKAKEPEVEPEGEPEGEEETETEVAEQKAKDGEELTAKEVRLLKVKLDGIEEELPEDEVVKGYQRQKDYTQKTQALAEERRKFEAEERAAVRAERQAYAERMQVIEEAIAALTQSSEPNWEQRARELAPDEFAAEFTAWQANSKRLAVARQERERVMAIHEQDMQRERQARLQAADERLGTLIPEWKDPEKGKVLKADLIAYAKSIGFSDDDLAAVDDDKPLLILHKARLWDESQKRRPKVEEKLERAIEAIKPSATRPATPTKKVDAYRAKLTNSGSIDDAANLLNSLMGVTR